MTTTQKALMQRRLYEMDLLTLCRACCAAQRAERHGLAEAAEVRAAIRWHMDSNVTASVINKLLDPQGKTAAELAARKPGYISASGYNPIMVKIKQELYTARRAASMITEAAEAERLAARAAEAAEAAKAAELAARYDGKQSRRKAAIQQSKKAAEAARRLAKRAEIEAARITAEAAQIYTTEPEAAAISGWLDRAAVAADRAAAARAAARAMAQQAAEQAALTSLARRAAAELAAAKKRLDSVLITASNLDALALIQEAEAAILAADRAHGTEPGVYLQTMRQEQKPIKAVVSSTQARIAVRYRAERAEAAAAAVYDRITELYSAGLATWPQLWEIARIYGQRQERAAAARAAAAGEYRVIEYTDYQRAFQAVRQAVKDHRAVRASDTHTLYIDLDTAAGQDPLYYRAGLYTCRTEQEAAARAMAQQYRAEAAEAASRAEAEASPEARQEAEAEAEAARQAAERAEAEAAAARAAARAYPVPIDTEAEAANLEKILSVPALTTKEKTYVLDRVRQYSYGQIAAMHGVSKSTVSSLVSRAAKKLAAAGVCTEPQAAEEDPQAVRIGQDIRAYARRRYTIKGRYTAAAKAEAEAAARLDSLRAEAAAQRHRAAQLAAEAEARQEIAARYLAMEAAEAGRQEAAELAAAYSTAAAAYGKGKIFITELAAAERAAKEAAERAERAGLAGWLASRAGYGIAAAGRTAAAEATRLAARAAEACRAAELAEAEIKARPDLARAAEAARQAAEARKARRARAARLALYTASPARAAEAARAERAAKAAAKRYLAALCVAWRQ